MLQLHDTNPVESRHVFAFVCSHSAMTLAAYHVAV